MIGPFAAALVATGLGLVASHEYEGGAPAGFSGGFKEASCHACHFHAAPNQPPGRVAIDGVPAGYSAGERYSLTVTLRREGMTRAGFQLTARVKDTGAQAGTLAAGPGQADRVGVQTDAGIQYAGQKTEGARVDTPGVARWNIEWTAPAAGTVTFSVAANAANGDESADGDFVYTASVDVAPAFVPRRRAPAQESRAGGTLPHRVLRERAAGLRQRVRPPGRADVAVRVRRDAVARRALIHAVFPLEWRNARHDAIPRPAGRCAPPPEDGSPPPTLVYRSA